MASTGVPSSSSTDTANCVCRSARICTQDLQLLCITCQLIADATWQLSERIARYLQLGDVSISPQASSQVINRRGTLLASDVMLEGNSKAVQPAKKGKCFPMEDARLTASPAGDSKIFCWAPLSPSPADSTKVPLPHLAVWIFLTVVSVVYNRHLLSDSHLAGNRLA